MSTTSLEKRSTNEKTFSKINTNSFKTPQTFRVGSARFLNTFQNLNFQKSSIDSAEIFKKEYSIDTDESQRDRSTSCPRK